MSYEEEYLCQNGHYLSYNCYVTQPSICSICKAKIEWHHSIDYTNGTDLRFSGTFPAPIIEIGFDDVEKVDHYGSIYFQKILKYKPGGPTWKPYKQPEPNEWETRFPVDN